jgi:hypothetical protein
VDIHGQRLHEIRVLRFKPRTEKNKATRKEKHYYKEKGRLSFNLLFQPSLQPSNARQAIDPQEKQVNMNSKVTPQEGNDVEPEKDFQLEDKDLAGSISTNASKEDHDSQLANYYHFGLC